DGGGDRADQDVAVVDVPEFVREHALEFLFVEQVQNACGDGDGGVLRVAPGGESVWRVGGDDEKLWHRDAHFLAEAFDNRVHARKFFTRYGLRAISCERNFVREEVGDEVHDAGNDEREEHAVLAAEVAADRHHEKRKRRKKQRGFKSVAHRFLY